MATAIEVQEALNTAWPESDYYKKYVSTDWYEANKEAEGNWDEDFFEKLEWLESADSVPTPLGTVFLDNDTERGSEGGGEVIYIILRLEPADGGEDQYFRIDGYYASWDGENWDDPDLYEVKRIPYQAYRYEKK